MTQAEKREYLIIELLKELPEYESIKIPTNEREQKKLLRSLFNIRMPLPVSDDFIALQNEYLREETRQKGTTSLDDLQSIEPDIYLWQGDITTLACDAIVNAANSEMLGCFCPCHGCIDNAIHTFAGVQLRLKCAEIMKKQGHKEETGKAKITPAYNLPCKYVLHTVGPIVRKSLTRQDCDLLASCYSVLLKLLKGKDYFVLTTNVDHQFQRAGFDKNRLFYTQGDYGLWQCSKPCHDKTYDNEETVRAMAEQQKDMKTPTELIPKCPVCGAPMTMNLRCDGSFVQDECWYAAASRYKDFIRRHSNSHILFLELGVGMNTPVIIKYPFWQMTKNNPNAVYACINQGQSFCPQDIWQQAICINADIGDTLSSI